MKKISLEDAEKKIISECRLWACWDKLDSEEQNETVDGYWEVLELGVLMEQQRSKILLDAMESLVTMKHLTLEEPFRSRVDLDQWASVLEDELKDKYEIARKALAEYTASSGL